MPARSFGPSDSTDRYKEPFRQPDIPGARFFLEANRFALWDLLAAIEQRRQPECNAQHARTVVEMIQGIYAAHLERRVVTLPLAERRHPLTLPDRPAEPAA